MQLENLTLKSYLDHPTDNMPRYEFLIQDKYAA